MCVVSLSRPERCHCHLHARCSVLIQRRTPTCTPLYAYFKDCRIPERPILALWQARAAWSHVLDGLAWRCRTASCLPASEGGPPEDTGLSRHLGVAAALMRVPAVLDAWVSLHGWRAAFEGFMTVGHTHTRKSAVPREGTV